MQEGMSIPDVLFPVREGKYGALPDSDGGHPLHTHTFQQLSRAADAAPKSFIFDTEGNLQRVSGTVPQPRTVRGVEAVTAAVAELARTQGVTSNSWCRRHTGHMSKSGERGYIRYAQEVT